MAKVESKLASDSHADQKPLMLNLACGQNRIEGWIGVDIAKTDATDVVFDLETYPWPWETNSVHDVLISHFIEHVRDLPPFMNELHRILKRGGQVNIIAPYYTSMRAMQDPYHVRPISEATFVYYNQQWRKTNGLEHYPITADFDFVYAYQLEEDLASSCEQDIQFAIKHYLNVVSEIRLTLTKR